MGPIVKELTAEYSDKSIKFVTFDFTTEESTAAGKTAAEAMGVTGTYNANAPEVGFVLLYDTKSQKVVTKLSNADETDKWREAITSGLGDS